MAMDGKELVEKLAKLSQVQSIKDIPQLTHALFPGTHCPLMGAAMAVGGIKDSLIVVVGTDECTYYTKSMTIHSEKFGGIDGRCVSVVLDDHDVTFGSAEKVQEAFKKMYPKVTPVEWTHKGDYHIAGFISDNHEMNAWFGNNARWIMTETNVEKPGRCPCSRS